MKLLNIVRFASSPHNFAVMAKKVSKRLADARGSLSQAENYEWIKSNQSDPERYARSLDSDLWDEALDYANDLRQRAEAILANIPHVLGGGGFCALLYFLVRLKRPLAAFETGVAAGWSTHAILSALAKNGEGHLYSSDFPYFRLPNPKQFIGVLVPKELHDRWTLCTLGDEACLPKFLDAVDRVDFLHYDSDKSYSGREFVIRSVSSKTHVNTTVVMDDIGDNSFFHDFVADKNWRIFSSGNNCVGLVENSALSAN